MPSPTTRPYAYTSINEALGHINEPYFKPVDAIPYNHVGSETKKLEKVSELSFSPSEKDPGAVFQSAPPQLRSEDEFESSQELTPDIQEEVILAPKEERPMSIVPSSPLNSVILGPENSAEKEVGLVRTRRTTLPPPPPIPLVHKPGRQYLDFDPFS